MDVVLKGSAGSVRLTESISGRFWGKKTGNRRIFKENNIDYCTDETNLEDHYTRNRLRNHVIPYLERKINPRAVSHMADTMEQMRTVWAFMEEEVENAENTA